MPWNELKMLRESAGLSQEALAKKISISQSALGNYERGTRAPDKEIVVKLANFFDVSCDFLLGVSKDRRREMNLADLTGLSDFTIDFMKQLPYGVKTEIDAIIKKQPELLRWLLYTIADLSRAAKTFSKERVGTVELDPRNSVFCHHTCGLKRHKMQIRNSRLRGAAHVLLFYLARRYFSIAYIRHSSTLPIC